MSTENQVILWEEQPASIVPAGLTRPSEIAEFAKQLSSREKRQVVTAYKNGSYEMATSFVWGRAMASLKRELGSLGVTFLAELLGKTEIDEDANVHDVVTEKEAIKLAEELGIISQTEAIRLRHSQELVAHFSQREPRDGEDGMEDMDARSVLLSCVKSVLAKPSIHVAKGFAEFRKELEAETFAPDDPRCDVLVGSPYFFRRLAVAVLLSGIRSHTGAKLEHCLSNLNLLLPLVWDKLRDSERWQVGTTYAQVYAEGLQAQTLGLKKALLKVRGFDYVPENLRSQTFLKAADDIIRAHEGMNNFYNEAAPTTALERLGTVIPPAAIGACITALLCVKLGNSYGTAWAAVPTAERILKKQAPDRWAYYIDRVLPGETRILDKFLSSKPAANWLQFSPEILNQEMLIKNKASRELVDASLAGSTKKLEASARKLLTAYYGKGMQTGI
jgi:hypothetical protein